MPLTGCSLMCTCFVHNILWQDYSGYSGSECIYINKGLAVLHSDMQLPVYFTVPIMVSFQFRL